MSQLKTSVIIDLVDRMSKPAQKARIQLEKIEKTAGDVAGFRKLKKETAATSQKMKDAHQRVKELAGKMRQAKKPSKQLSASFTKAKREAGKYKRELKKQSVQLHTLRKRLHSTGVSTKQLSKHQRDLKKNTARTTSALKHQEKQIASLNKKAKQAGRSTAASKRVKGGTGAVSNRVGRAGATAASAIGFVTTVKMVGNLERRFTRLGIQANKSKGEMASLKSEIFETAQAPDIRIDPSQLTSAIEAIVEKTGDLDFARANIRNIGLAIQATGADGGAIGEILGEFQKMGIKAPAEVLKALDVMNVQGKEGAFTLENLASLGPRVITAYTALGRTGTGALREMGAALQIIRQGTGSSEMAATAFEAVLRTLSDSAKIKKLQAIGVEVRDADGNFRAINEIMAEIIKTTGGDKVKLGKIFDAEAVRAFNSAASEFKRTGSLQSLDKFMNVMADGTTTINDSKRAAEDFNAATQSLSTSWTKFADRSIKPSITLLGKFFKILTSEKFDDVVGGGITKVMAALGNDNAQNALDAEARIKEKHLTLAKQRGANANMKFVDGVPTFGSSSNQQVSGLIKIQIDGEGRPKLKSMTKQSGNVDFEIETGHVMRTE